MPYETGHNALKQVAPHRGCLPEPSPPSKVYLESLPFPHSARKLRGGEIVKSAKRRLQPQCAVAAIHNDMVKPPLCAAAFNDSMRAARGAGVEPTRRPSAAQATDRVTMGAAGRRAASAGES